MAVFFLTDIVTISSISIITRTVRTRCSRFQVTRGYPCISVPYVPEPESYGQRTQLLPLL